MRDVGEETVVEQLGVIAAGKESADPVRILCLGHESHDATAATEREARPLTGGPPNAQTIGYVSKFPPSPSGIALYASVFEQVLKKLGKVERVPAPANPRDSQRLASSLRGFVQGFRDCRTRRYSAIHVELGGRSLFEFYYALGALQSRRTPVSITCHDTPSVVGQPCLFTILDRRGLRRVGTLLSSSVGAIWERRLIYGAQDILCLTRAGADALSQRFVRQVRAVAHVVDDPGPLTEKEDRIFLPGYLSNSEAIAAAVSVTAGLNRDNGTTWKVVVGACPPNVEANLRARLPADQAAIVTYAGFQTEDELLQEFRRARVVVRIRRASGEDNSFAASGPLAWAAARGCVILTNDSRAGAQELAALGLAIYSPKNPLQDLPDALAEAANPAMAGLQARRAQTLFGIDAVAQEIMTALRVGSPASQDASDTC